MKDFPEAAGNALAQQAPAPAMLPDWGHCTTLVDGPRFKVRHVVVRPGGRATLHAHVHRAEHWVVVAGTGKATLEGEERLLTEDDWLYVPLGARHAIENPGRLPLVLIEVQTGCYIGEDDLEHAAEDPAPA